MIMPKQKIQVFISSACGEALVKQKYNIVREALKTLIESTGFVEAYVFESEGASTASAGQHYTFALEDCDLCIFLIDNEDGVSSGVQREIDIAKKYGIKSLFYFCDQTSKEETPLQKSLKGAQYAKTETIHDFKDLIKCGAADLINDLVMIYKHYCRRRLDWREEPHPEQTTDVSTIDLSTNLDCIAQKDVPTNIDCCVEFFTELILNYSHNEIRKTGVIDQLCASFLPVLFEGVAINKDSLNSLLSEIEKHQSPQHFAITKKRYEAVSEYYSGNLEACIKNMDEALRIAKLKDLPEWLIKDILIDLRNHTISEEESRNRIDFDSVYQKELDSSLTLLYYPLLDRLSSNYYEGIVEQAFKHKTEPLGTFSFGHGLSAYFEALAGIYVLAMYNGSLSHLQLLHKRVKFISFYCATKYPNWNIKKLLLKISIYDGNQKEIDGIMRCFEELYCRMDESDAYEIYTYAKSRPIAYQRFISMLEAFRITAYFMDDEFFNLKWCELYQLIFQWIEDDNSAIVIGGHIFSALEGGYLRIPQDQMIEIMCKCISNKKRRFYDDIFKLLRRCINLDQILPENAVTLLNAIIDIIRNKEERDYIFNLGPALYMIRKKNRELTEELDKVIAEEMPDFYNDIYRLETTIEEKEDMPKFLEKYIAQIRSDNERQGKNGVFSRGPQPHITIKNILQHSEAEFSEYLINSVFKAGCDTLLTDTQAIDVKMDAIELLVYLLKSNPKTKEDNIGEVEMLLSNKAQLEKAHSSMTNLNVTNLRFSALLLYNCLGENIIVGLLEALADISGDISSNLKASASILNYLDADCSLIPNIQLEHIFLQQAIEWSVEDNLNIRLNGVQILFSLLRNEDNKSVVCNQMVKLVDNDNVYIKNRILQNLHLIKNIDIDTYKYIIQKATVDSNYVVRKVANRVSEET